MRNIVMTDLDGVIFDKHYRVTTDTGKAVRTISASADIVPNSDTPMDRLSMFYRGATGINEIGLIGENGSIVRDFEGNIHYACSGKEIKDFRLEIKRIFVSDGHTVCEGPIPIWIREKKRFQPNSNLVLIDNCRERSVSLFFLTSDNNGNLTNNKNWCNAGGEILRTVSRPCALDEFDFNPKYGIFISSAKGISKTSGYLCLKRLYPDVKFFMIGDSDYDIIDNGSIMHLAVGNATPNLKDISFFIAKSEFTQGFIECLEWLNKQL
jgi:hydroxymethylpyrimidine pyrophosphatase-like HAD family hydrolase